MFDNYFCFIFKSFFFSSKKKKNVWLAWEKMISKIKHKICLVIVFEPFHLGSVQNRRYRKRLRS